jgi:DNA repair protein RadC
MSALRSGCKEALALVDIRLLDHIIVGDGASVSLAERGVI